MKLIRGSLGKHSLLGFVLSIVLFVQQGQAFEKEHAASWIGQVGCLLTIKIMGSDIGATLGSLEDVAKTLPGGPFTIGPNRLVKPQPDGKFFMMAKTVKSYKPYATEFSCVTELEAQCLSWQQQFERSISTLIATGLVKTGVGMMKDLSSGSGCWPIDDEGDRIYEDDFEPVESPWPLEDVPGFSDNMHEPTSRQPVFIPVPTNPLSPPVFVRILPSSNLYPFAAEVARLLSSQDISKWVKNAIVAVLSIGTVAAAIMFFGGITNAGASTAVSWGPIFAAGAAIVLICNINGIEVDEAALTNQSSGTSSTELQYLDRLNNPNGLDRIEIVYDRKSQLFVQPYRSAEQNIGYITGTFDEGKGTCLISDDNIFRWTWQSNRADFPGPC